MTARRAVCLTGAALCLAACGTDSDPAEPVAEERRGSDYTIDPRTGERRMTVDTPDGQVALRSGPKVAIDLPSGFSLMKGARVTGNTIVDQADGKGAIVMFETDADPENVVSFYRDQAEAAGIDIEIENEMNGNRMLGGRAASGLTFSLSVTPIATGTRAQLVVGEGADYAGGSQ